jgi:hypothetical protein
MTPNELLAACAQAGVTLKWDKGGIKACGEERAVLVLLPLLKVHKFALLSIYEESMQGYYDERAAIAEYDGGLTRSEAEAQAFEEMSIWRKSTTLH